MLTEMADQLIRLSSFRDDPQAGIRTWPAGNKDNDDSLPIFFVIGLSAFLLNDRTPLSRYDLPKYLAMLQSDDIHELLKWTPDYLPDDLGPLWQRYWASVDRNEDTLVEDLLGFLMPGRSRRHDPWSTMPLPPGAFEGLLASDSPTSLREDSPAPALVSFYDASVSEPDVSSGDLWDDQPFPDFDDPPISVPDESSASAFDDPPISVPDYLPVSESNDLRAFVVEGLWGIAVDSTFSGRIPNRDRLFVFAQDIKERFHEAGVSDFAAVFGDMMRQLPSVSEAMQMDTALGLELDVRRTMKTVNFLMMTEKSIGKESPETQSQPSDRQWVAFSVLEIVWMMTGSQACFDPRDRVFGTFGFFGEEPPSELSLSHEMGLDELYSTFCRYLLVESAIYSVTGLYWWPTLQRATQAGKRCSLPSWCPDFQQHVDDGYKLYDGAISTYGQQCQPQFKAGAERPIRVERGLDWSQIVFRGRLFDSVLSIHSAYPWTPTMEWSTPGGLRAQATMPALFYDVALWESELATQVVEAPMGDAFEAYWETLIGNGLVDSPSFTRRNFLDFQSRLGKIRDLLDRMGIIER